ncbi:Gcd10p_family protein [Hexamita inflata]|uniref:tRNA (adenine(58)-N(1))-methyltransferase non-catalytic subunit TRM6 n=1 Tax=Hexamita inflata TaxID=28002 RepID=A0ABP1GDW7_9EUKA
MQEQCDNQIKTEIKDNETLNFENVPIVTREGDFIIQQNQTVIVQFKDDRAFIAKLDPTRPLKLFEEEIPAQLIIGQGDAQWWQVTNGRLEDRIKLVPDLGRIDYLGKPMEEENDVQADQDEKENVGEDKPNFKSLKNQKKNRVAHGQFCRILIATPYLLAQYYFSQNITQQNRDPWFLSGASLGACMQNLCPSHLGSQKCLIVDDYEGVASAAVTQRLLDVNNGVSEESIAQVNLLVQEAKIIQELIEQGKELPDVSAMQLKIAKLFHQMRSEMNLKLPHEQFILQTGQTSGQQLKAAIIDSNILPIANNLPVNAELKRNQCPAVVSVSNSRFHSADIKMGDIAYTGQFEVKTDTERRYDSEPLNPESMQDFTLYEYQMWFERKLQLAGLDIGLLSRILNIQNNLFSSRKNFRPYFSPAVFEQLKSNALDLALPTSKEETENDPFFFTSLFICSKARPLISFKQLSQFVAAGSPVVVFHQFMNPLVELSEFIVSNRLGTRLGAIEVVETVQQILPGRSHPAMTGQVCGGYVLKFFIEGESEQNQKSGMGGRKRAGKIRM